MRRARVFWTALLLLGGVLLLTGLSRRDLWQDEAETALLARSVVKNGRPIAYDGLNVVSGETRHEFGSDYLWRWSPWLQLYIAAGSFAALGESAAHARLPFALIGLCCLPLCWWWVKRLFSDESLARLSAALLAVDVPFLLHMRQARWYAPACAAACGLLGFGVGLLREGKKRDAAGFALCAVALFYANFLVAAALYIAFACAAPVLRPSRRGWMMLAGAYAGAALLCLPGAFLHLQMAQQAASRFSWERSFTQVFGYASAVGLWVCPAGLLALALYVSPEEREARFLLVFLGAFVGALALGPWRFFRYLSPVLPVGAALSAFALAWVWRRSRGAAAALAAALVLTDLLSAPLYLMLPLRWGIFDRHVVLAGVGSPIAGYLYEISHDFDSCDREAAAYLNAHAKPGQVVIATYGDLVLQFYTKGLKIVGGGQGLKLPADPDWIIAQPNILSEAPGKDGDVFRFLAASVNPADYEQIPLSCQSALLGNCPEPWTHEYDPSPKPALKLLRRFRPPLSSPEELRASRRPG